MSLIRLRRCAPVWALCVPGLLAIHSLPASAQMGDFVPPVRAASVETGDVSPRITLVGTTEPRMHSLVASEREGRVVGVPADEGDLVEAGVILARLDGRSLELELREARAALAEGQAQLELAEHDLERARQLFGDDIRTLKELQDAEAERAVRAKRTEQFSARVEKMEVDLERTGIRAPFGGAVVSLHTEIGEWVREGGPIAELVDLSRVHVVVDVPERYINAVTVGDAASVTFDALAGRGGAGVVIAVIPQADETTRTFPVKVELPNAKLAIKGGMLARVTLRVGEGRTSTLVPKDALVTRGEGVFVYVVEADTVRFVPVVLGVAQDTSVEVQGPLQSGELVVVRGNERLRPGQTVRLVGPAGAAP